MTRAAQLELSTPRRYETTLDRAGLALLVGGLLGGALATVLALGGGMWSPTSLALMMTFGTCLSAILIVVAGGPLWLVSHWRGARGPVAAMMVGAVAGFALFLGGQTYGFGLFAMPVSDSRTLTFRWLSGAATSAVMGMMAAGIGLAMWRVAYRREQ